MSVRLMVVTEKCSACTLSIPRDSVTDHCTEVVKSKASLSHLYFLGLALLLLRFGCAMLKLPSFLLSLLMLVLIKNTCMAFRWRCFLLGVLSGSSLVLTLTVISESPWYSLRPSTSSSTESSSPTLNFSQIRGLLMDTLGGLADIGSDLFIRVEFAAVRRIVLLIVL